MLNFSIVRVSRGGALDGQHVLGFARAHQVRVLVLTVCKKFLPLLDWRRLLRRSHRRRSCAGRPQLVARTRCRISLRTAVRFHCVYPLLKMERLSAHLLRRTDLCPALRAFIPSARVSLLSSMGTPQRRMIHIVQRHTRFHVDRTETLGTLRRVRGHLRECSLRVWFCGKSKASLFTLSCAFTGCFSGIPSLDLMTFGVHSARHEQYSRFRCIAQAGRHTRHL